MSRTRHKGVCRASAQRAFASGVKGTLVISGVITGRHVIRHGAVIVREFGAAAYLRCCMALILRRKTTFLDCVCRLEQMEATSASPLDRN